MRIGTFNDSNQDIREEFKPEFYSKAVEAGQQYKKLDQKATKNLNFFRADKRVQEIDKDQISLDSTSYKNLKIVSDMLQKANIDKNYNLKEKLVSFKQQELDEAKSSNIEFSDITK